MNKLKKFLICLTLLCLVTGLAACGEERPEEGKYICRGLYREEELIPTDAAAEIVLDNSGEGYFSFEGSGGDILWSAGGERLVLRIGSEEISAALKDYCISIPVAEDTMALFFKVGSEIPPELMPLKLPESFYGWWRISDSEGEMPETWIDCCGAFDEESRSISFWDEDGSRDEPMGVIELSYMPGGEAEAYRSRKGWFWYTEEQADTFIINTDEHRAYTAAGAAEDKNGDTFSYEIYLRPWGDEWIWEKENDPDKLPYFYDDWYLPLIEAGEAMPDKIAGIG